MKNDFYIGWSDDTPAPYLGRARKFFLTALILLIGVGVLFVTNEQPFIDSRFEYGTLSDISGTLVQQPVWSIRTEENGQVKTIPLVGFGKSGPERTIQQLIQSRGLKEGAVVTLRGTLFHYQDKSWMELTEGEASLIKVDQYINVSRMINDLGRVQVSGEIVDPKCFFGVMNPATKAVHRSCAIRCISGGIPPVLAIRENGVFVDYYFIKGREGQKINDHILPYVGVPVTISGKGRSFEDWKTIELKSDGIQLYAFDESRSSSLAMTICN
jgi:uncharacterized protein YdeI (BOF family)